MKINKPSWLLNSKAYKKALSLVKETLQSSEHVSAFLARAQDKLNKNKAGSINAWLDSLLTSFRLLKCYVSGEYREISFESLALIVASITYFVMPFDVVPDFFLSLGFLDDAALLAWTFKTVAEELRRFVEWEKGGKPVIIDVEPTQSQENESS